MTALAVVSVEELALVVERAVRKELDRREGGATLSTEEAAALAKRDPKTIRRWLASGDLPSTRRGRVHRIRREDLDAFLAGGRGDADVDRIVGSLG